MITTN